MSGQLRDGNRIDLLDSGAEFFPALLAALASARHEIFLETYIYAEDDTAGRVTDALADAARRGVAVRVVLDGFGARDFAPRYLEQLHAAGATVLVYRPPLWWHPVRGLRRMHRKMAVIDTVLAFVGGINIIDDWNTPDEVPPRYDYTARIAGPLVADMADAAWHLWGVLSLATLHHRQSRTRHPPPPAAGGMRARLLVRDNLRHRRDIEDAYLEAIRGARTSILLAIAYFLPSRTFFEELRAAARRGVRVRILMQGPSDQPLMQRASQFLYRRLHGAGIEVLEYRKSFLHTKVAVVDGQWATVGSSNLDPFSLLLSREANIEVFDAGFAATLSASIEAAIADGAAPVTVESVARFPWHTRLAQWLSYRFTRGAIDWLNLGRKN